jgi:glycosyltransferase involved in cell wall biosynthesis
MKVLLFMPYTATPSNSIQIVAYNILQGLVERQAELEKEGLDVVVLSEAGGSFKGQEFNFSEFIKLISYKIVPPKTFIGDMQNFVKIFRYKKSLSDVDLVHSHDILFTLPAAHVFQGKTVIHNFHGLNWKEIQFVNSEYLKFAHALAGMRYRFISKLRNIQFVCISQYVLSEVKNFLGVPEEKLEIIPNPISEDFFRIKKTENPGLIFYPARLIPRKNHLTLLKALAILKKGGISNFTLVLTGNPEDLKYYKQIINLIQKDELSENVMLLGKIPRKRVMDLYSQASIVVLTSFEETFSLAVAEAMATGTPVIASPVGMIPETIENGKNGFIINPTDPNDVAQKIRILLEDTNLRKKMGEAGKITAIKNWRAKEVADKIIKYWIRLSYER